MNMTDTRRVDIKVLDEVPENLIAQVDRLLEENDSNNRIKNEESLGAWSKERFPNQKDRYKYVVAIIDQEVVGTTIIFKRTLQYKGKPIILGGLGAVGVRKEYRGKGIGTQMLSMARKTLNDSDADIAFLGTDIQDPQMLKIYGRIGFVPLNRPFAYIGKSGKRYEDLTAGMIAPIHSQELFNQILKDTEPFYIGLGTW